MDFDPTAHPPPPGARVRRTCSVAGSGRHSRATIRFTRTHSRRTQWRSPLAWSPPSPPRWIRDHPTLPRCCTGRAAGSSSSGVTRSWRPSICARPRRAGAGRSGSPPHGRDRSERRRSRPRRMPRCSRAFTRCGRWEPPARRSGSSGTAAGAPAARRPMCPSTNTPMTRTMCMLRRALRHSGLTDRSSGHTSSARLPTTRTGRTSKSCGWCPTPRAARYSATRKP